MTQENNNVITINDKEYTEDQLTNEQKVIINHIGDLDRKIQNIKFNLDQLSVGREAFVKMLTDSLEENTQE